MLYTRCATASPACKLIVVFSRSSRRRCSYVAQKPLVIRCGSVTVSTVRPSVTNLSKQLNEGSRRTLRFSDARDLCEIPVGLPPTGAPNTGGVVKIGDLRLTSRCISETVQDANLVTVETYLSLHSRRNVCQCCSSCKECDAAPAVCHGIKGSRRPVTTQEFDDELHSITRHGDDTTS